MTSSVILIRYIPLLCSLLLHRLFPMRIGKSQSLARTHPSSEIQKQILHIQSSRIILSFLQGYLVHLHISSDRNWVLKDPLSTTSLFSSHTLITTKAGDIIQEVKISSLENHLQGEENEVLFRSLMRNKSKHELERDWRQIKIAWRSPGASN